MQREAGRALEQGLEASHAVRPEGVVTQVQLHQLGPGCDESFPERDLGTEELMLSFTDRDQVLLLCQALPALGGHLAGGDPAETQTVSVQS